MSAGYRDNAKQDTSSEEQKEFLATQRAKKFKEQTMFWAICIVMGIFGSFLFSLWHDTGQHTKVDEPCKSTLYINPPAGAKITCENGVEPQIIGASVKCSCPSNSNELSHENEKK